MQSEIYVSLPVVSSRLLCFFFSGLSVSDEKDFSECLKNCELMDLFSPIIEDIFILISNVFTFDEALEISTGFACLSSELNICLSSYLCLLVRH